jgi:hypothetical protein
MRNRYKVDYQGAGDGEFFMWFDNLEAAERFANTKRFSTIWAYLYE